MGQMPPPGALNQFCFTSDQQLGFQHFRYAFDNPASTPAVGGPGTAGRLTTTIGARVPCSADFG